MHFSAIVIGLWAEIAATALVRPVELAAADDEDECVLPAAYTIANFVTVADKYNGDNNVTSFDFSDADTGITTFCEQNSTSPSISPNGGTARYYCDDTNVEFIYQTTGIAGLTLIERACPDSQSSTKYEAAGLTQFNLTCTDTYLGTSCVYYPNVTSEFTSLNPVTFS